VVVRSRRRKHEEGGSDEDEFLPVPNWQYRPALPHYDDVVRMKHPCVTCGLPSSEGREQCFYCERMQGDVERSKQFRLQQSVLAKENRAVQKGRRQSTQNIRVCDCCLQRLRFAEKTCIYCVQAKRDMQRSFELRRKANEIGRRNWQRIKEERSRLSKEKEDYLKHIPPELVLELIHAEEIQPGTGPREWLASVMRGREMTRIGKDGGKTYAKVRNTPPSAPLEPKSPEEQEAIAQKLKEESEMRKIRTPQGEFYTIRLSEEEIQNYNGLGTSLSLSRFVHAAFAEKIDRERAIMGKGNGPVQPKEA
jgi:hypothetical protein